MDEATRARLLREHVEIGDRVLKLEAFIPTGDFTNLPREDQSDLIEQLGHMRGYLAVLSRRVGRLRA